MAPPPPPRALASEEERTRSEVNPHMWFMLALRVPPLWRLRRSCWPRACKTSPWGRRKRFPGGFSAAPAVMVKKPAGLKTILLGSSWTTRAGGGWRLVWPSRLGPGGLTWHLGLPGVASTAMHALRQLTAITSCCPTWRVKAQGTRRRKV
jgi:hypothetical protein